ncbi:hypothetical protein [Flavobacterium sp.]|uniref:hypothetical protein n=1 Tax=Flavobacterium sp. TaxID=239 RepID=UPI00261ED9C9|nr:hypothetical protein [Flavobacterium sp.]MDG2431740.1 hypothetical protein [Flavobacterium sp.]
MRNIFIVLLLLLINFSCKNNSEFEKENLEKELIKLPPPPKKIDENSLVGFACYYSGRKSKPVENITEIIEKKKFEELKKKIISNKPAEKYLATFACIKLLEKGIIKLNNDELNQIDENKRSDVEIYFCGGCTEAENYKLSKLLSEKTEFTSEVENWFNRVK